MPRILDKVHVDEKVWGLEERIEQRRGGPVRLQVLTFKSGRALDDVAEMHIDLGLQAFYADHPPIVVFLGNEYSVGEALEMANRLREVKPEPTEPSPIAEQYLRECEEMRKQLHRQTVIGSGLMIQRN